MGHEGKTHREKSQVVKKNTTTSGLATASRDLKHEKPKGPSGEKKRIPPKRGNCAWPGTRRREKQHKGEKDI